MWTTPLTIWSVVSLAKVLGTFSTLLYIQEDDGIYKSLFLSEREFNKNLTVHNSENA
jgi:hypothetical protein